MNRQLLRVAGWLLPVLLVLLFAPPSARANRPLERLRGSQVVVTTKGGKTVRGWLLRVWPNKILIDAGNNTFIHVPRHQIARIRLAYPPRVATKARAATPKERAHQRLASAKKVRNAGIGVTVAGLIILTAGWGVTFIDPFYLVAIAGLGIGSGLGGTLSLAGGITWTVGAVRLSIARAGKRWKAKRRVFLRAGAVITATGGGLGVLGSGLLAAFVQSSKVGGVTGAVGLSCLVIGFATGILVGLPMLLEAHLTTRKPHSSPPTPAPRPNYPIAHLRALDPLHETALTRQLTLGPPRPMMFTTGFSF